MDNIADKVRYKSIIIKNFKNILDLEINLEHASNITPLIGLNESGKSNILEAISLLSHHSIDLNDTYKILSSYVPHHLINNQADIETRITANIALSYSLRKRINKLFEKYKVNLNHDIKEYQFFTSYTYHFSLTQRPVKISYDNGIEVKFSAAEGDNDNYHDYILNSKTNKLENPKNFQLSKIELEKELIALLKANVPNIQYLNVEKFNLPASIDLQENKGHNHNFCRSFIKSIVNLINQNLIAEEQISYTGLINDIFTNPDGDNKHLKVIGKKINKDIVQEWLKILDKPKNHRRLYLLPSIETTIEGKNKAYLQMKFISAKKNTFYDLENINSSFSWFMMFMLIKKYYSQKNTLFLIDEPEGNLYPKSQDLLLEFFTKEFISKGNLQQLIYTTHSPYMINPDLLDYSYIISNDSNDDFEEVSANKFKQQASKHTYYQAILDQLNIIPNKLEINRPCILVEGKSDYYILKYALEVLTQKDYNFSFIPMSGTSSIPAIASLLKGWNIPFMIILDADKAGNEIKQLLLEHFCSVEQIIDINNILKQQSVSTIESLFTPEELRFINQGISNYHFKKIQVKHNKIILNNKFKSFEYDEYHDLIKVGENKILIKKDNEVSIKNGVICIQPGYAKSIAIARNSYFRIQDNNLIISDYDNEIKVVLKSHQCVNMDNNLLRLNEGTQIYISYKEILITKHGKSNISRFFNQALINKTKLDFLKDGEFNKKIHNLLSYIDRYFNKLNE